MSQQDIIYLNLFLIVFFSILFVRSKRQQKKPSLLDLKSGPFGARTPGHAEAGKTGALVDPKSLGPEAYFNYNGHSFNAYEVLGLQGLALEPPPRADDIQKVFLECLRKSSPDSHEFFKTALETLLLDLKRKGIKVQ